MLAAAAAALPWLLVAVLALNLAQRRLTGPGTARASVKRAATLLTAGLVLVLWAAVLALRRWTAPEWTLLVAVAGTALAAIALRRRLAVFPRSCRRCGRRLGLVALVFEEDGHCANCAPPADAPDQQ